MDRFIVRGVRSKELSPIEGSFDNCETENNNSDITNKNNIESKKLSCHYSENCDDIPKSFPRWKETFPWLLLNPDHKVVCSICCEAINKKLISPSDMTTPTVINSRRAFVENGFNTWKNAVQTFRTHESSNLHRLSITTKANLKSKSVIQHLSTAKKTEMEAARVALKKIFTTVQFLVKQGQALRGSNNDENSNLTQALKMRSEDVPEIKTWLNRTGNMRLSHDIVNEIITIFANEIVQHNLEKIKQAKYFAITLDETSDISKLEQVSICFRIVEDDLTIQEIFMRFYETSSTKSATLFSVVKDVLLRYGLSLKNLRGQCYDGAANVSGCLTGLQTLVREEEPRALFVHCNGHRVNLVVQDGLEDVTYSRNFIGIVKELINFIHDSPKRLAWFKELQSQESLQLSQFCPTRWCLRIKSLKTIHDKNNYDTAMRFFEEVFNDLTVDSSASAKALGFLKHLQSFEFYFLLTAMIEIFSRIEVLNTELQKSTLIINESHKKVQAVLGSLMSNRESKFENAWANAVEGANNLKLNEPKIPRQRKASSKFETKGMSHAFLSPKDYYRKIYFEIYDRVTTSMKDRFQSETMELLNSFENFVIGKDHSVDEVIKFYGNDFDQEKLKLHREMFLDIVSQKQIELKSVKDVVTFLNVNPEIGNLVSEFKKLIKILITIPSTSCTNERSFSSLRRLKTYLRSTMTQKRLNNIAVAHIHQDILDNVDVDKILNEFISRNDLRRKTLYMC